LLIPKPINKELFVDIRKIRLSNAVKLTIFDADLCAAEPLKRKP